MSAVFRVIDFFEVSNRPMSVLFGTVEQGVITPGMVARFGKERVPISGLDSTTAATAQKKMGLIFKDLKADQILWLQSLRAGALLGVTEQKEGWLGGLEMKSSKGASAVGWTPTEVAFLSQGEVRDGELFLQADAAMAALEYALEMGDVLLGVETFEFRGEDVVVRTDMWPKDETDGGEVGAFFRAQREKGFWFILVLESSQGDVM